MRVEGVARRNFIFAGGVTLIGLPAMSQAQAHPIWISNEPPSMWHRAINLVPARKSQLAFEGRIQLVPGGVGLMPSASLSSSTGALVAHPSFQNLTFETEFQLAVADYSALPGAHPMVAVALDKPGVSRIMPTVVFQEWAPGQARLKLTARAEVEHARSRNTSWECHSETLTVLPVSGPGSWTEEGSLALKTAVRHHARDIVQCVAVEAAMAAGGLWKDPVDPSTLIELRLKIWPENMYYSCLQLGETAESLIIASANKSLGHLGRRGVFDKRLIADLRKPS